MNHEVKTLEQRRAALQWYVERCLKKGFSIQSRSATTAELYKPAGFPAFLRREQTKYVQVDQHGRVYVRTSQY